MKTWPGGRWVLRLCSVLGIALPLQAAYPQTVGDATPAPRQ